MMRFAGRPTASATIILVAVWCALWGSVSVANVLSGVIVALLALAIAGAPEPSASLRLVPLAKLLWLVLVDLGASTVSVAREVATPGDQTSEAIVAVDVATSARRQWLLIVVAITLTPGTAVIEADRGQGRLELHLLHRDRGDAVVAHTHRLAALAAEAFPVRSSLPDGAPT